MRALSFWIVISAFVGVFGLTGCLQTRESQKEQEEKVVLKQQVNTLQSTTADTNARFQDLEDENRKLSGKIEALEAKLMIFAQKADKANANQDAKSAQNDETYKEEFQKINTDVASLKAQLTELQEEKRRAAEARAANDAAKAARDAESAKNPLAAAEDKFEKKMWKEAILDYEKYRSSNPKGKSLALATYKIGLCFQELGMIEEAKAFFEEVLSKYPKSKDAAKAEARLKAMNGKKHK